MYLIHRHSVVFAKVLVLGRQGDLTPKSTQQQRKARAGYTRKRGSPVLLLATLRFVHKQPSDVLWICLTNTECRWRIHKANGRVLSDFLDWISANKKFKVNNLQWLSRDKIFRWLSSPSIHSWRTIFQSSQQEGRATSHERQTESCSPPSSRFRMHRNHARRRHYDRRAPRQSAGPTRHGDGTRSTSATPCSDSLPCVRSIP